MMDATTMLRKEVCVLGMARRGRSVVMQNATTLLRKEECAFVMERTREKCAANGWTSQETQGCLWTMLRLDEKVKSIYADYLWTQSMQKSLASS